MPLRTTAKPHDEDCDCVECDNRNLKQTIAALEAARKRDRRTIRDQQTALALAKHCLERVDRQIKRWTKELQE